MTDEIKITRRIALEKMYEFYEIQWTTDDHNDIYKILALIDEKIEFIREHHDEPTPEISPKKADKKEKKLFTYFVEEKKLWCSVPFEQKDLFRDIIVDVCKRRPFWNRDKELWELPEHYLTPSLESAFRTSELYGVSP